MTTLRSRLKVYVTAVVASILGFLATMVLILEFKYPDLERVGLFGFHPIFVALAFCVLFGALLALVWPGLWRDIALFSSSAFWGFFGLAFLFLLLEGQFDAVALAQAVSALAAAAVGALLGRTVSPRSRREVARRG